MHPPLLCEDDDTIPKFGIKEREDWAQANARLYDWKSVQGLKRFLPNIGLYGIGTSNTRRKLHQEDLGCKQRRKSGGGCRLRKVADCEQLQRNQGAAEILLGAITHTRHYPNLIISVPSMN